MTEIATKSKKSRAKCVLEITLFEISPIKEYQLGKKNVKLEKQQKQLYLN